jgi:translation initiation factor 1
MTSDDGRKPFNNPFGALRDGAAPPAREAPAGGVSLPDKRKPAAERAAAREAAPAPAIARGKSKIGRAVIRMERSGRGGKEVTIIELLALGPAEREKLLKALKSALGCGGTIEGDALVLQGDQRNRLEGVRAVFHSFGL